MFGRFLVGIAIGVSTLFGSAQIAAAQDPVLIGPNQSFVGFVNGSRSNAVIEMACFGPITPGETGHPLAGQTLEVKLGAPISAFPRAFTGNAHAIDATFELTSLVEILLAEFRSYFVPAPLSTELSLPCSGSGWIHFDPVEGGPHARGWNTKVTFVSQP